MTSNTMARNINISCMRGEKEMKYQNEKNEIIDLCLKYDLIKKTDNGYVIKRSFFELIDEYKL